MGGRRRRERVEPTEEWEQLALLCRWPEQLAYEEIRPLTLFGASVAERARETGTAERTLYRRVGRFEEEGVECLFGSEAARRKRLPSAMRRLVVDLKAEYPGFNPNEIANAVYVRFARRPDRKTVQRVLEEEPTPLRFVRRFPPYHEMPKGPERRLAVVALHGRGVERQGHLRLPTRPQGHRPQGPEVVGRGRARGTGGPSSRPPARRAQSDAEGDGGRQEAAAESGPGRVSGPRRPRPGRHPPEPPHLRQDPGPEPRALRAGEAERSRQAEARDALRRAPAPPVLDRRRPLPQGPQARRQGVRDLRIGQPLESHPRERPDPLPGPRLVPLGPLRRR